MAKGGYTVGIEPWLQTPFWQQQGYSSYAEWQAAQGGSDTPASDSGQWSSAPVNMPQKGGTRSWQDSDNMWWQELQGVQHPVLWGQYETPQLTRSQGTVGTPQENILQTKKLTQDELGSYFWDVGNTAMNQAFHSSGVDQTETAATQDAIKSLATRQSLNNLQRLLTNQGNTRLKSLIDRYDLTGLQDKFNAFSKDVVSQGDLDSWQGDQEAKWGNWTNQQQQKIGTLSDKFNSQIGGLKDNLGDFQANNTAKWNQNASQWNNWNSQWEKASDKLNNTEKQTGLLSSMLNDTQGQLDSFSSSTNASLNNFNSQMAQAVQKQQAADAARGQLLSRLQKEEQVRQALAGKVSTNTYDISSLEALQKAGFSGAEADRKGLSSMIERTSDEWSKRLEEETRARAEAIKHVDSGWLDGFKNLENKVSDTQNDLISRLTDLGSVLTGKIDDSTTAWQTGNEALNQQLEAATDQLSQADEDTRDAFVAQLQESEASWQETFGATKEEILNELNMTEEEFYSALGEQGEKIQSNWEATIEALTNQKNEFSNKVSDTQNDLISRLTDLGSVLTGKIDDSTTAWQTGNEALNQQLEAATDQLSQADEDTRDAFIAQLQESEASWQEAFGTTKEEILNELNMTEEEFYSALGEQGDTIESNWEATLGALTKQKNESDKLAKEQKALEEQQKQQAMEQRKAALEQAGLWDHVQRLYASDEEGLKAFLLSGQLQNQTALSNWAGQQQQSVISDLNQQYATAVAQAQQALKAQGVTDSSVYRQAEDALRAQRGQILSAYRNAYAPSSLGALLSGSPEDIAAYQIPTSISDYGNGLSGFASLDPTLSQYVSGGVDENPLAWLNNSSSAWNSVVTKQGSGGLLEAALRGYLGG